MKHLTDYMQEKQTEALNKAGAFFAFSQAQFNVTSNNQITMLNLNLVTCGQCGEPFAHKLPRDSDELHCPYCDMHDDIYHFPDIFMDQRNIISVLNGLK